MVAALDSGRFVASNDASSVLVYTVAGGVASTAARLEYDAAVGVANSALSFQLDATRWLVTGHENGDLLGWTVEGQVIRHRFTLGLRSPDPVPSPHSLFNVRAVVPWRDGLVVTGSEDGDLCVVDVPLGRVVHRIRYNPDATRGINDVAIAGDTLVVANCSVGRDDRNCWAFALRDHHLQPIGSVNLVADTTREQVFNFAVELVQLAGTTLFVCATEEGLLWFGEVNAQGFTVEGPTQVSSGMGAAVTFGKTPEILAVVGDNVHLFDFLLGAGSKDSSERADGATEET